MTGSDNRGPGWFGRSLYTFSIALLRFAAWILFRFKVSGRKNVPRKGGLLVVSNHVSHLDPPLVGIAIPRYVIHMAKRELFSVPFLFHYMNAIGTILVDRGRGRQAVVEAVERLKDDHCVIIFPEGTRSTDGVLKKGRSGAVVIAIQSGCQILPVAISGSEKAMTKGTKRIKCVPVNVKIGDLFRIDYDGDPENIPREVLRGETFKIMEKIEALLPEEMKPDSEQKRIWYGNLMDGDDGQAGPGA